jgi:hypothetical protein
MSISGHRPPASFRRPKSLPASLAHFCASPALAGSWAAGKKAWTVGAERGGGGAGKAVGEDRKPVGEAEKSSGRRGKALGSTPESWRAMRGNAPAMRRRGLGKQKTQRRATTWDTPSTSK